MTIAYIVTGGLGNYGGGSYPTATEIAAAVLAAATTTPIAANMKQVNSQSIDGSGTTSDPWGPA